MGLRDAIKTVIEASALVKAKKAFKPLPPEAQDCLAARLEETAKKHAQRTAIIFEDKSISWAELNALANQYAGVLRQAGMRRGDTASLFMENRIEFLAALAAMNKLGITAALINTNLTGIPLVHCLKITGSKLCIFGEERCDAIADVRENPDCQSIEKFFFVSDSGARTAPGWSLDMAAMAMGQSKENPPETAENQLGDVALYIFTSGTTGLPKASVILNRRMLLSSTLGHMIGLRCTENDCIYICLPLYHSTGLFVGAGGAFSSGARMLIRRKFSASQFLPDVRAHGVTCFVYIGELCRYLCNTPEAPDDANTTLVTIMGNGLRPDIWMKFKTRFGIKRISEFYASSEGNVAFVNMFNKDCTVGLTPNPVALVKYDVENDEIVRTPDGRLQRVAKGEPGLMLGKITQTSSFDGYTSKAETEKKILRNGFEDGDAWFNTGDLMKTVPVGFALGMPHYQFVDRVGDTFRWKSENVSTSEVGEIICGHPHIELCNVYGVEIPGTEGKAGMAAITLAADVTEPDLHSISAWVKNNLPSYGRPVFLRILPGMDTTSTFKMVKSDLRAAGYDLARVPDPLYVMKPGSTVYEALDEAFLATIKSGQAGY